MQKQQPQHLRDFGILRDDYTRKPAYDGERTLINVPGLRVAD